MLLQNTSEFLLHNVQVLLENVIVITKFNKFIFRCKSYYQMRRTLSNASRQTFDSFLNIQ